MGLKTHARNQGAPTNCAPTFLLASMVTTQNSLEPAQAPVQPAKRDPIFGTANSLTTVLVL
jgi:hypothetical protein